MSIEALLPHYNLAVSVLSKTVGRYAAEDAVHDAITTALQSRVEWKCPDHAKAWLFQCAYHRGIMSWRKHRFEPPEDRAAGGSSPFQAVAEADDIEHCQSLIDGLPPTCRDAIRAVVAGESIQSYARRHGISDYTARSRIHYARRLLSKLRAGLSIRPRGISVRSRALATAALLRKGRETAEKYRHVLAPLHGAGKGPCAIANHLNRCAVPSPQGRRWASNQVARMLKHLGMTQ